MTRQKKSRREAGRIPVPESAEQDQRQRRVAQNKLKARQRSQFDQLQDEQRSKRGKGADGQPVKRKTRLKQDPAAVAQRSQELMDQTEPGDRSDSDQS
ncbi:hypothetical protein DV711_02585 [Motiliproteus coralliicola]|uniref:Uncharacterized protein n=1 Tax=Motiliproteus coralliicola TaxID=2283196 RepID=A0A369WYC5_9GAMM|nr:hypothetical protein [Motiliproteus coralliicola]RDE24495.1 hypothetical protein DV711_02585 [Motiliproteus coralliicola]